MEELLFTHGKRVAGQLDKDMGEKVHFDSPPYLTPCIQINSRWIKVLNNDGKTTELQDGIGECLHDLGTGKYS